MTLKNDIHLTLYRQSFPLLVQFERFEVNLKEIPHLKKFLKLQASKYVKKSGTFTPQEIEQVILHLQENITHKSALYDIAIPLVYFGLLRANEMHNVEFDDVAFLKEGEKLRLWLPLPMIGKGKKIASSSMSHTNTIQCMMVS